MKSGRQKIKWALGVIFTVVGILLCLAGLSLAALIIWRMSLSSEIEVWLVNLYDLWALVNRIEPSYEKFEEFASLLPIVILAGLGLSVPGWRLFDKGQKLSE